MATGARKGKFGADVARIGGALEIRCMARIALCQRRLELAGGCSFVASVAVERRMRSGQRKTIVVILNLLYRDLPASHRVALFTIRAQLASMNIRMAILATLSDVVKHRLHVTLGAGHGLMHTEQRITCLIVVEFGNRSNGLPGICSMAVLTGDIQVSVRAMRAGGGLCGHAGGKRQE